MQDSKSSAARRDIQNLNCTDEFPQNIPAAHVSDIGIQFHEQTGGEIDIHANTTGITTIYTVIVFSVIGTIMIVNASATGSSLLTEQSGGLAFVSELQFVYIYIVLAITGVFGVTFFSILIANFSPKINYGLYIVLQLTNISYFVASAIGFTLPSKIHTGNIWHLCGQPFAFGTYIAFAVLHRFELIPEWPHIDLDTIQLHVGN